MRGTAKSLFAVGLVFLLALSLGCTKQEEPVMEVQEEVVVQEEVAPVVKEPYKIGAIFSVTGPASFLGDPEKKTAEMIVEDLNKKGGINGHPVELIVYDTTGEETATVMHMKKLIEKDNVLAIAGSSRSGTTFAVIPIAEESEVPLVSCAASVRISKPVKKWVFQTPQTDVMAVEKIIEYLKGKNLTKIGIITVSNGFGKSGKAALERILPENGIEIVANEVYNPKPADLKAQIKNLEAGKPQAIICWGTNPGPASLARNMKEMGVDLPLIMSHGVASKKFIQLAGAAAEGIILPAGKLLVASQLPDSDPQKQTLLQYTSMYESAYNEPVSTFGGHGWDAIKQIILAIQEAGPDRAKIRDALEKQSDWEGIGGIFKRNENTHNGLNKDAFALVVIENGDWKMVSD